LYGGGGGAEDDEDEDDTNNAQVDQQQEQKENNTSRNAVVNAQQYDPRSVYASAKGDLYKFNPKREEFKVLVNHVEALIIEHDSDDFVASFQIIRKNGQLLFSETISNELQIQYNKSNHSMVFAMYNEEKDRLEILSFIFNEESEEEAFKMAVAIKLYETNRQESFDKLLKTKDVQKEEQSWMTDAYRMDVDEQQDAYEETDKDLYELCDDVNMLDVSQYVRDDDDTNNDDDDADDADDSGHDEEEKSATEEKPNKWEQAASKAYDDDDELQAHIDGFAERKKGGGAAHNRHITGSKLFNRTYVVREMKPGAAALGYFHHNDENELEYQGKIAITDRDKKHFTPSKVMQHQSDRSLLLLDARHPEQISVMNLDKGKVVEEWQIDRELQDIVPLTKHDDMTDNPMVYGLANNAMFQIDARIPKENKVIDSKQKSYKSIHNMRSMATSGNGFIATGAEDGKIRLYDCVEKKAKTCLPGLGNEVKHIEISDDGQWILATCTDYIMAVPTQVPGTQRTGFEGRGMGTLKPHPYVLRLKVSDMAKYKLRKVSFTPAHFDQGKSIDEHWIITSTGPYIIKWNFNKLKKSGIVNSYSIRRAKSTVVHNEFRFNHNDDLLVTEANSVYAQHSAAKK